MKGLEARTPDVGRGIAVPDRPMFRALLLKAAVAVGLLTACDVEQRSRLAKAGDALEAPGPTPTSVWREATLLAALAAAFGIGIGLAVRRKSPAAAQDSVGEAARFDRELGDAIPGMVAVWDRFAQVRYANRAFLEDLGLARDAVIGRSVAELFGAAFDAPARARLDAAQRGEPQQFERAVVRPDGRLSTHLVHYTPWRGPAGETDGVCVMAFDITALKESQAALSAANAALAGARDAAESTSRAKSAFLANLSHEIRTPLSAIMGISHLLGREFAQAPQRRRLEKVAVASQHLLAVVDEVLELSKIEAGRLVLDARDFSRDECLGRSIEMVAEQAREKGIELVLDTDHLPEQLRGDALRLSQMLLNLLANAVNFTTTGWVCLRGRLIERRDERLQLRFEVEDTGAGISAERQARLFTPFDQAEGPAERPHGGTGLGLALTRQLARAMGGDAGVTSAEGVGSTFWFTVWVDSAVAAQPSRLPPLPADLRVLLVDDLAESRDVIAGRLCAFGIAVDAVSGGPEALRRAEAAAAAGQRHDLLLIDESMPGIDGIETWRRLRERLGSGALPPTLLMLSSDDSALRHRAREAGLEDVLVKPLTPTTLWAALRRALRLDPFDLPADGRGRGASEVERRLQREHAGQSVLVVEDHPLNREVASDLLGAVGLRVDVAGDGAEALEMARAGRYDLILMDMRLPGLDGLEATRRWRGEEFGARVPIVALTANAFSDDRAACLAAGMDDHLVKPVGPEQLYATLLRWLPASGAAASAAAPPRAAATSAAAGAALIRRFEAVDGLEVTTALRNVGGQAQFLAQVLERFVESYAAGEPSLLAAPSAESLQGWRSLCHSIRGAAATIGAVQLADDAQALESGLRSGAQAAALARQASELHEALKSLATRLASALAPGQPG